MEGPHPFAHERNIGTKWLSKPYSPLVFLYDKEGWVTHTVIVGEGDNPEGPDDRFSRSATPDMPSILAACGLCSKSEARRKGFNEVLPYGQHERRVGPNMVLYIYNNKEEIG